METLVDMEISPQIQDYASWAFHGSGVEDYWTSFEEFCAAFIKAGDFLINKLPTNREWSTVDRFKLICTFNSDIPLQHIEEITAKLEYNYFKVYTAHCVVHKDVFEVLTKLSSSYKLGVVSNFKTDNGIENILEKFDIFRYFQYITTSIKNGWRKPHPSIYREIIEKTHSQPNDILFVGDDLICDYQKPKEIGMNAILLDRKNNQPSLTNGEKIRNFYEFYDVCNL